MTIASVVDLRSTSKSRAMKASDVLMEASIRRRWRNAFESNPFRPHRDKTFKLYNDVHFAEKLVDVDSL